MKEYYGNYLGICINNQDPEFRGRVQIFIPHIMPALYEGWNQEGQDITIECVGNNLPNGLSSAIIEKLKLILPWAEGAMPIVGTSVGGQYNPATGNFNQTAIPEGGFAARQINPDVFGGSFSAELSNPDVQRRLFNLMEAEVGGQGTQAQLAWMETVRNRATVRGVSINTIISDTKYYEPYKTGAINKAASRLTNEKINSYQGIVNKALAGSNITNGATHNASAGVAASVKRGGYDSVPGSVVDIGGETYYSKTFEQNKLSKIFDPKAMTLNDPAGNPTPGALTPTTPFWQTPEAKPYTQQQPDSSALTLNPAAKNYITDTPWSAGFISYAAGSGSSTFPRAGMHTAYATAVRNGSAPGWTALNPTTTQLQPGDIVIKGRAGNTPSFNGQWTGFSHGDIVTSVSGGVARTIGGNVQGGKTGNGTVGVTNVSTNNGVIASSNYFAVLRPPASDATKVAAAAEQEYSKWASNNWKELSPGALDTISSYYAAGNLATPAGGKPTALVSNPSPTQIIPTDTTGMPAGMFAIPGPGAMLWVFFREGNPLFPVYFAASYGKTEWQNAYLANSQPSDYGNVSVMRTGAADATISNSNLENPYTRQVSFNGSYNEYDLYGQNQFVRGNKHSYTEGVENRQCAGRQALCIQDSMDCTLGDRKTIVGNPSQECLDQVQKIKQKIAQVNNKMLEGGNNSPAK